MKRTPMRKRSKKKAAHMASEAGLAEIAYMGRVKQLPCSVCGRHGPSDAHHCIHDRFSTAKRSGFHTIPLCKAHHQDGPDAIHNGKDTWRMKYGADHEYLAAVKDMLAGEPS